MYRLIYPSEKPVAIGFLLFFLGLPGVIFLDPQTTHHPTLRFIACCLFLVGWLWWHAVWFVQRWNRNPLAQKAHRSPNGFWWMRIVAIVLWLGVLPFAFLWVYHYLERLRTPA